MSGQRALEWGIRLAVPLAVLAVVLAVFFGERMSIDHELQVRAPREVAAGAALPVQTLLVGDLEALDGPHLYAAPAQVRLVQGGEAIAEATLEPAPGGGAAGTLDVPADASGALALVAVGFVDGEAVASATRAVRVTPRPAPASVLGRLAGDLQLLAPGPITPAGDAAPPWPLEVRVVGGACVPEARCEILVHVGEPAARVRFALSQSATVEPGPELETAGLVSLAARVHGPEAHVVLEAYRGDALVATREVQLPVALATPALALDARLAPRPELTVQTLGDRPGLFVDAYRDGIWTHTAGRPIEEGAFPLPYALDDGLWRLQVRTDPFSSERAAIRYVAVGSLDEALAAIDAAGGDRRAPEGPDALRLAWAAASLEVGVHPLPAPTSGMDADLARVEGRQRTLRLAALLAMALGLIVAVIVFMRRGIDAALEAQRVMDETGDPELSSARHRRRTLLSALLIVVTVLLAFVGAAALIVARAHLLE
ncbi:MAG: hypothetical protein VYE22_02930 [Myxococcota bacterium]|nr:hypothetical protein [Myxococcota bacterium]